MSRYLYLENYFFDRKLRSSFNALMMRTFSLSLEKWYQAGHWSDRYIPRSLLHKNEVAANISTNQMDISYCGRDIKAVLLSTVMTGEAHRNQGLARILMEQVLDDFQNECDFIYLFANPDARGFYEKFGFEERKEYETVIPTAQSLPKPYALRKLSLETQEDMTLALRLAAGTAEVSPVLSVRNNFSLTMFFLMTLYPDCLYYCEETDSIFVTKDNNEELQIADILGSVPSDPARIAAAFRNQYSFLVLMYTPEEASLPTIHSKRVHEDVLYMLPGNKLTEKRFIFPGLSRG